MHSVTLSQCSETGLFQLSLQEELLPMSSQNELLDTYETKSVAWTDILKIQSCEKDSQLRVIQQLEKNRMQPDNFQYQPWLDPILP